MPRETFSKRITSDELTAQIKIENIKLVDRFIKEKSTRTSNATIKVYKSNLNMFMTWNLLYNDNKFFIDIKKLEYADFFSFCVDELRLGSARLNNIRSVLSSLSLFIEKFMDEQYPSFRNVILKTIESTPKEIRRDKTILSDEQVQALLDYLFEKDKQKACWLALAVTSGARFSELLRFDVDIIDENRVAFGDLFIETSKMLKTKGRGKSGKMLYKYILKEKFLQYYKPWLEEREKIMIEKNQTHNSMFIQRDGTPATEGFIRQWFDEFEKFLGVTFYPHSCRHFVVTLFSKKNIPYNLIKELIGWSNLEMCAVYDDTSARDKKWSELDNLKI